MLTTGTVACSASSASVASLPVRSPIAATLRDSTSAVSRTDSPRLSWSSPGRITIGWPPSSTTPTSNDVRVRVDGCSNTSATLRLSSTRDESGAALSASARSSSADSSPPLSSLPVRKWRGKRASVWASATFAAILVVSWNLFHGRAVPAAGRPLAAEFAAAIAGWEWDVALLQEVPPWWPSRLAAAAGASARMALTGRNSCLCVRRAIAARNPDLVTANGGGCNAILVRAAAIGEHRTRELTRRPERRVMHGLALGDAGWVVNLHGSTHPPEQRRADLMKAAATALEW